MAQTSMLNTTRSSRSGSLVAFAVTAGLGAALLLAGCDNQAANVAQMQVVLDGAIEKVDNAESGYIPVEVKQAWYDDKGLGNATGVSLENKRSLADHRQQALDKAVQDLQTVASSTGSSDAQKAVALKTLAAIDSSAARHLLRQASGQASKLISESGATLLDHLAVIERLETAASLLDQNDQGMVQAIETKLAALTQEHTQTESQHKELVAARDAELSKEKAQRELAAKKVAQGQAYASKAIVEKGARHYDLLDKAAAAKREAAEATTAADGHQLAAEQIDVRITQARQKLDALSEAVDAATAERDGTAKRLADTQSRQRLLHQDRDKQFKELLAGYDKLREAFASDVDATLEQARGRAKSAIDRLEQAQRLSPREARDAAAVAEVGAHTDLAAVLTRHAVAAESLLALTQTLDAGLKRTGVARDSSIAAGADELAGQRDALADAANAAIADAGSAANRAQSAEADRVAATLESYKSQLPAKSQSN